MELLKTFGIEPLFLSAQIVNFLIILYLLKRFAYKPVLDLLKKREETIKQGLKDAEQARILLEQAEEKEKKMLQTAQMEARKMQDDAKKQAVMLMEKMETETKEKTQRMLKDAKEQIERESKEMEIRLEGKTSEIAVAFLEKALKGMFDQSQQQKALQHAVKQIKKVS